MPNDTMNFGVDLLPVTDASFSLGSSSKKWIINGVTNPELTDTTYSSLAAASGGTAVSLVTTGEKYNWNNMLPISGGTITNGLTIQGYDNADSTVPGFSFMQAGGILLFTLHSSAGYNFGLQYSSVGNGLEIVNSASNTWAFGEDGTLTLAAAPTANMHAATKQYVDNAVAGASASIEVVRLI